jgi:hypothetical protein
MKMIKKIAVAFLAMVIMLSMAVPAFAAGAKVNLISMHELESDDVSVIDDEITDSYGKSYSSNILRFSTGNDAFITYDLNGQYESFDGSIVCGDSTGSSAIMSVAIYADGEKLYELKGYTRQKAAESFNIDVSGVGELSIKTTQTNGYNAYLYFVDSTFTKADSAKNFPSRSELSDLVVIDSRACTVSDRLLVDVFGNVHNGWTYLDSGSEGYVLFNLDKKYVSLTGSIVTTDNTGNKAVMDIEFFLDDELVYSESGITRTSNAIDFTLDVSNASVLKITTSESDGNRGYIYVVDSVLKAHEHIPADWTIQTAPTCTEEGEQVQICTDCGEVIATEKITATGHTPDGNWVTESDATCGEEGEQVQHCSVCKEICDTQKVEKLPHTPSDDWTIEKEPTCEVEGIQVKKCTVCGAVTEEEAIPTVDHSYGSWKTISGSVWNNPILKERTCSVCGDTEYVESNSTSWLKPLVIVLFIIIFGGIVVIIVTLKMNGLALEPASIKKLFSKESLTDDDIDDILNKPDDNSDNK